MKAQNVTKKQVTPKWVDRLLIGVLVLIPVLYVAGFSVNYGPSMSHLGWFYRTSWGEQPTRIGQVVRFAKPNQPAWRKYILPMVKRVADIRPDGLFVEGDNENESEDSRDWGKTVPSDHVAGVVVWCWSPIRAVRCWNAEGSFVNWLSLNLPPNCYKVSRQFAVAYFPSQDTTRIYQSGKEVRSFPNWKIRSDWVNGHILLGKKAGKLWSYMSYNPVTNTEKHNLDSESNPDLSDSVSVRLPGMTASGGVVYALDSDPATNWIVGPTKPKDNLSRLDFCSPFTGTISLGGTVASGTVLKVLINREIIIGPLRPWEAQEFSVKSAKTLDLTVSKIDETESMPWKVSGITFQR